MELKHTQREDTLEQPNCSQFTTPNSTYIADHVDAQAVQIADHVLLLWTDLGVRKQLDQILLWDSVLDHHVQRDYPDFVVIGDVLQ